MADNLCGPSNALQNFQKHTSADRTLQQDRLTTRQTPAQSFRSSPGPNAGILDPEFDAFQAGHHAAVPAHPLHHQPGLHFPAPHAPQQHFAQAPPQQAPDWASDFQRLNISAPQQPPLLQHHRAPQPQAANHAAAWHQDFLRQQGPSGAGQAQAQQQTMFGGIPRQGMGMGMGMGFSGGMYQQAGPGFGMMNGAGMSMSVSETAQGKQRVQEPEAQFDDAAFEEAFKQAEVQDRVYRTAKIWQEETEKHWRKHFAPIVALAQAVKDSDFVAVEKSLKEWTAAQAEGELDPAQLQLGLSQLQMLSDMGTQVPQHVRELNNRLIESINARLMSENPLFAPVPTSEALEPQNQEHVPRQDAEQEQEQQQQQQKQNDDDAMAATAGQLLTSVADNTSEKFKNSQFLELMRRLRDREVRVEEDKIVDVDVGTTSVPVQSSTSAATASSAVDTANTSGVVGSGSSTAGALDNFQRQLDLIEQQNRKRMEAGGVGMGTSVPPIDREILNHAATDFELPVDSTDEMTDAMFK